MRLDETEARLGGEAQGEVRWQGVEALRSARVRLTVVGADGKVTITKGQKDVAVRVQSNHFTWYCGKSEESTTAPTLTNLIRVSRASEGREITWKCYFAL